MQISKIRKKYCVDGKVQLMFSNAPSQIILSSDGYLYLREKDTVIHRYLTDPVRDKMPYKNTPSSANHATHLFEYDKLYAKFTRYRNMGRGYSMEDSYSLTFLYFVRAENGEAICAELSYHDFEEESEVSETLSRSDLERFLYDISISEADAKCIFEWFAGIRYVKHKKEVISIHDERFLKLDDNEILDKYNAYNEPTHCLIFDEEVRKKKMEDKSWMVHSIDEVHDFTLTHRSMFGGYEPIQLVVRGNKMYLSKFEVIFVKPGKFELKTTRRVIDVSYNDVLKSAHNLEYPHEPDFDDN